MLNIGVTAIQMDLIKYFLSSNQAASELQNTYLISLLNMIDGIKIPATKSFATTLLPNIIKKLQIALGDKLKIGKYVILIVDIWTTPQMADFLGLGACIINSNFEKEFYVIGITRMPGAHNSENIQIAIESIINNKY